MWIQRLGLNQIRIGKNMYESCRKVLAPPPALKRTMIGKYANGDFTLYWSPLRTVSQCV